MSQELLYYITKFQIKCHTNKAFLRTNFSRKFPIFCLRFERLLHDRVELGAKTECFLHRDLKKSKC